MVFDTGDSRVVLVGLSLGSGSTKTPPNGRPVDFGSARTCLESTLGVSVGATSWLECAHGVSVLGALAMRPASAWPRKVIASTAASV